MIAASLAIVAGDGNGNGEAEPATYVVAELRDGTLVVGRPEAAGQLAFDCALGRVQLPVERIERVEMHDDGEGATVFTTASDQLHGHFDVGTLDVQTDGGRRRVPLAKIARWHYDARGNAGNVALRSRGATVTGPANFPESLLDGKTSGYHGSGGWARSVTPATWTVTLPRAYPLRQIRLLLYDRDTRAFRYTIETSADGKEFEMVADHGREWSRSWQDHGCSGRPVRFIRLQALDSTFNDRPRNAGFFAVELEAYCRPVE